MIRRESGQCIKISNKLGYAKRSPAFTTGASGSVTIRHKEYIGDIGPTLAFGVTNFDLNPGMDIAFPWLSQIAPAFQEYKWNDLIFTYQTQSSDLVTGNNPSLGTVMMATDYNAVGDPFLDKRTMENFEGTTSSKPSLSFVHVVNTKRKQTAHPTLYTRSGPPPPNADKRLYDIGTFALATQGMQATDPTTTIGALWVSYSVTFMKPKFDVDQGIETDIFSFNLAYMSGVGGFSMFAVDTVQTGKPQYTALTNTLGCKLSFGGPGVNGRITFPYDSGAKTFLVSYAITGNGVAANSAAITTVGAGGMAILPISGSAIQFNSLGKTSTTAFSEFVCKIGQVPNEVNLPYVDLIGNDYTNAAWPQSLISARLIITEINGELGHP